MDTKKLIYLLFGISASLCEDGKSLISSVTVTTFFVAAKPRQTFIWPRNIDMIKQNLNKNISEIRIVLTIYSIYTLAERPVWWPARPWDIPSPTPARGSLHMCHRKRWIPLNIKRDSGWYGIWVDKRFALCCREYRTSACQAVHWFIKRIGLSSFIAT